MGYRRHQSHDSKRSEQKQHEHEQGLSHGLHGLSKTITLFNTRLECAPTGHSVHRLLYFEMAESVFSTDAIQSSSTPMSARMASTFSGITSDSW